MNIFFGILSLFSYLDLYGTNVNLLIENKRKVKSKFGGFISLLVISISLYLLALNIISWRNNENLQIISSSQSFNTNYLSKNGNISYTLDSSNYFLYFHPSASLPNGSYFYYYNLKRYFVQTIDYTDENLILSNGSLKGCSNSGQLAFLEDKILIKLLFKAPLNKYCLDKPYKMGLFRDIENNQDVVRSPSLSYKIHKCRNSTANNFSCASNSEIKAMLQFITISIFIPDSRFDFNNIQKPRKRAFELQKYHLDFNSLKWFTARLSPVELLTDEGIWEEEYKLDSIDFNSNT